MLQECQINYEYARRGDIAHALEKASHTQSSGSKAQTNRRARQLKIRRKKCLEIWKCKWPAPMVPTVCGTPLVGAERGLETAAQTTEVVDSECAEQVDCSRGAETDTKTFRYVHGGFTTITLTEGNLHTSH